MNKFKLIFVFMFLSVFTISCDSKNDSPLVTSESPTTIKVQDQVTTKKDSDTIEFNSKSTNVFPGLDRDFSIDKIAVVDKNTILFKVTNVSTDAVSTTRLRHIELRPIKNGHPTKVRSKVDIARIVNGELEVFKTLDDIYPGESALIIQEIPIPFTQCEDYAIAYAKYACKYRELDYAKLSDVIDCNSSKKQ